MLIGGWRLADDFDPEIHIYPLYFTNLVNATLFATFPDNGSLNQVQFEAGPPLNNPRRSHACGVIKDTNSK